MESRGGGRVLGDASVKAEPAWEDAAREGEDQRVSELARQGNVAEAAQRLQAGAVRVKVEAVDVKQEPADLPDKPPRVSQPHDLVITELMCVTVEAEFVPGEGKGRRETAGACGSETAHPAERDQGLAAERPEVRVKVEAVDTEDVLELEQAVGRHTPGHVAEALSPGVRVKVESVDTERVLETEQAKGERHTPEFVKVEAMDTEHVLEKERVKERHTPEPSPPEQAQWAGTEGAPPCPVRVTAGPGARRGAAPPTCPVCSKICKTEPLVREHMRIHTGEKPYPCKFCGTGFRTAGHLNRHERVHTGEKPYACRMCTKKFSVFNSRKRHERLHTGERPYSCEICKKEFISTSNLRTHKRIHTDEKPFSCDICGQKYKHNHSLKEHRRIHTGERPFACGTCNKEYAASGSLKKHELHCAPTTSSV